MGWKRDLEVLIKRGYVRKVVKNGVAFYEPTGLMPADSKET